MAFLIHPTPPRALRLVRLQGAPVFRCPVPSPTVRSAMKVSSVSPERCDTKTPHLKAVGKSSVLWATWSWLQLKYP